MPRPCSSCGEIGGRGEGRAPWSMEAAALEPSPVAIAIWES